MYESQIVQNDLLSSIVQIQNISICTKMRISLKQRQNQVEGQSFWISASSTLVELADFLAMAAFTAS